MPRPDVVASVKVYPSRLQRAGLLAKLFAFALLFAFACAPRAQHQSTSATAAVPGDLERPAANEPSAATDGSSESAEARAAGERAVVMVIRGQLRAIQRCFEGLLASDPELGGRVRLFFTVDDAGATSNVRATRELRASVPLAECIVDIVRPLRFQSGIAGDYDYPFVFAPEN